jgi:hypothetical protein
MIVPQTTSLIKRAAELTGIGEKTILLRTRDRQVNTVRTAIFQALIDLGHTRNRIAEAFACDAKTIQWALDHPSLASLTLLRQLTSTMPFRDCGSGQSYGICSKCGKGHGYVAHQSKPTAPAIGLRYSR